MPVDHEVDGMPKRTKLAIEGELRGVPYLVPDSAVRRLIQGLEGNVGTIGKESQDRSPSRRPRGYPAVEEALYVRFATDSPVEGAGFEPVVPPLFFYCGSG